MNFDNLIDNSLNGKSGKSISFVDVGCGYGGLLCTNFLLNILKLP